MAEGIFNSLVIKSTARCNLNCRYCYWFRDKSVYGHPPFLERSIIDSLSEKLISYIANNALPYFSIFIHGGEPLLYGRGNFEYLFNSLRNVEKITQCEISISITTNGTLLDDEWCNLIKKHRVGVAISIDGPKRIHDLNRVDFKGNGSFESAIAGVKMAKDHLIEPWILAVANENISAKESIEFFVNDLNIKNIDFLIPDQTFDDKDIPNISQFYIELFDLWYDIYSKQDVKIRYFEYAIRRILGNQNVVMDYFGDSLSTAFLYTNGSMGLLDALNITQLGHLRQKVFIKNSGFDDFINHPEWAELINSSKKLSIKCDECVFKKICGGGCLPHRYSNRNGFENPSVYCEQLKKIYGHIIERVFNSIDQNKIEEIMAVTII